MLLVDYGETEVLEDHIILDKRVCPDDDSDRSVLKPFVYRPPFSLRGGANEQFTPDAGRFQILPDVGKMLLGKHFRRSHYTGLVTIADSYQCRKHRNHGLSGTHITLQQAVHLMAAHEVRPDLLDHPLLGSRELIGQGVVAGIEGRTHLRHRNTVFIPRTDVFLLEQGKLQQEEFLPFQPVLRLGESSRIGREMDVPDGIL